MLLLWWKLCEQLLGRFVDPEALPFSTCILFKGSLDEKLPIYEQDPKSKRLDSFEKRFVRD